MHWFDELAHSVDAFLASKSKVVCNAGLSVSGLQHVGRLRGEIVLNHFIASHLRDEGKEVVQHLVLYTQDPWKGSPKQVAQFAGDEGKAYTGWRLIDVPDPHGCHGNWVDHFWEGFGSSLQRFAPGVEVTTTTEIYEREEMIDLVRRILPLTEEIRRILNDYRPRNPHPEGWVPFEPLCDECHRVGQARALEVRAAEVDYECGCGHSGTSHLSLGKLNWRVEWPALWALLKVDVEPFGKDHAAPGGSRESCAAIAEDVIGIKPPLGIPYEWVGLSENGQDRGDMDSSDFVGFGPEEWLEMAEPEILRFLYANIPIRRRVVLDLAKMDLYHQAYDQGEAAFFSGESPEARSYSLSLLGAPPSEMPFQVAYRHASIMAQAAPPDGRLDWSTRRLEDTGLLDRSLTQAERELLGKRLEQSLLWVTNYGPEDARFQIQETLPAEVREGLSSKEREALAALRGRLEDIPWLEGSVKDAMVELTGSGTLRVSTKRFFAALYTVFLGKPSGPRAAPLLVVLDRDFVLSRLDEASRD